MVLQVGGVRLGMNPPRRSVHRSFFRHDFEWKREECFMLRKPDPPVLVAVTKEPPGRLKTTSIQILDYNLNRCAVGLIPLRLPIFIPDLTLRTARDWRSLC
jgi:hypothetical protein